MSELRQGLEVSERKKLVRQEMLQKRKALSAEQRDHASQEILRRLYQEPAYRNAKTVMAYVSMRDEVQLDPLLEDCLRKGKQLAIPLIVGKGEMEAVRVPSLETLVKGAYGILTVREEERQLLSAEQIDCVIVPGAAFSRKGERLGLGGGYYDRFLERCPQAVRMALAFSFQLVEELPVESHDITVDWIITEQEYIKIKERI